MGVGLVACPEKLQWTPPTNLDINHSFTTSTDHGAAEGCIAPGQPTRLWVGFDAAPAPPALIRKSLVTGTSYFHSHVPAQFFWLVHHGDQIQSSERSHLQKPGLTLQRVLSHTQPANRYEYSLQERITKSFLSEVGTDEIPAPLFEFIRILSTPVYFWN